MTPLVTLAIVLGFFASQALSWWAHWRLRDRVTELEARLNRIARPRA